jgi:hypothetical protein
MLTWWDPATYLDAVSGAVITPDWGDRVKENLDALFNPPQAHAISPEGFFVPNNAVTALIFGGERYDTDVIHSTTTNTSRLTCVRAGVHHLSAGMTYAGSAAGNLRIIAIRLNGVTTIAQFDGKPLGTATVALAVSADYKLALNDYVEVITLQDSGGNLTSLNSPMARLSMRWAGVG